MNEFVKETKALSILVEKKSRADTFIDFIGFIVASFFGVIPGLGIIISDGPRETIKTPALASLQDVVGWPYLYGAGMAISGLMAIIGIIRSCSITSKTAFCLISVVYWFHSMGFAMNCIKNGGPFYLIPIYLGIAAISTACCVFVDDKT